MINHILLKTGLIETPLAMLYNEGAVIMGLLQYLLPFMILNIYVSLDGIDKSLAEAAKSLGCTEWQAFKEVTLPLSLPGVSAGCLLVFVLTCGTYLPPMILGGPGNGMIANLIFKRVIGSLDWALWLGHLHHPPGPADRHCLYLQPVYGHQPDL